MIKILCQKEKSTLENNPIAEIQNANPIIVNFPRFESPKGKIYRIGTTKIKDKSAKIYTLIQTPPLSESFI